MDSKTRYKTGKEKTREKALKLFDDYLVISWKELQQATDELYTLGKRYGLLKEFRENGII